MLEGKEIKGIESTEIISPVVLFTKSSTAEFIKQFSLILERKITLPHKNELQENNERVPDLIMKRDAT